MYRIYLDWNVITQLKGEPKGEFAQLAALIEQNRSRFWIPYSSTHLNDISRGYDPDNQTKVDYTMRDLEYLGQLTQYACFQSYIGQDRPTPERRDPTSFFEEYYADQQENNFNLDSLYKIFDDSNSSVLGTVFRGALQLPVHPFPSDAPPFFENIFPGWKEKGTLEAMIQDMYALVNRMNSDYTYSVELRNLIQGGIPHLDSRKVSSAKPAEAYQRIEEILAPFMGGKSLFSMLEETSKNAQPAGKEQTAENRFIEAYFQLEYFNFHPENLKPKNHFPNILGDATHAFLAGHCNFFVTNDKTLRLKAEAVYKKIPTSTKIFSVADFIKFITEELVEYTPESFLFYLQDSLNNSQQVPESVEQEAGRQAFILPYLLLDRFNIFENELLPPNGRATHFIHCETTYSYFTLRDEIQDLIDTLARCLGPDDAHKAEMVLPDELNDIYANTWIGRCWSFNSLSLKLACIDGEMQFSIIIPQLPIAQDIAGSSVPNE